MKHKGNRKVEKQFVREIKQPPTIVGSFHLEGLERRILVVNIFCPFLSLSFFLPTFWTLRLHKRFHKFRRLERDATTNET